jgi:predicted DNA-binding protein with PD1-like motif
MRSHEVSVGRTVVVAFDHGEDFFTALDAACRTHAIRQGYIPMFIGALSMVEIVGTCERIPDPDAPIWTPVHLTGVDTVGAGTLAYDEATGTVQPHVHLSAGVRGHSAIGHTSHLLRATVQYLTELVIVEVLEPRLRRVPDRGLYDLALLRFGNDGG